MFYKIDQILILFQQMLVGFSQQDMQEWSTGVHRYQKQKRTKKPFGKQFKNTTSIVNSSVIREEERSFNPVLQTYFDEKKQLEAQSSAQKQKLHSLNHYYNSVGKKTIRDFDIINLHGSRYQQKIPKNKAPIRNIFNPINNEPLPAYYFNNREVRLNPEKDFKDIKPKQRDFNIVTGLYKQDHQLKHDMEIQQQHKQMNDRLNRRGYDAIYGRYYDAKKEQMYKDQLAKSQIEQSSGEKYNKRFPPTYIQREPLVLDPSKPLTQSLVQLDKKKQNAKQRFKLKYLLQRQYELRNIEYQQKKQAMLHNRIHNSQSFDHKAKQFDIDQLNRIKNELNREVLGIDKSSFVPKLQNMYIAESRTGKQRNGSVASQRYSSQSQSQSSYRSSSRRASIKSGGFF